MRFVGAFVVLALAAAGAMMFMHKKLPDNGRKADMARVHVSEKIAIDIFVDKNSIDETVADGMTIRKAAVVYRFKKPFKVKGQDAYYVAATKAYHCSSKMTAFVDVLIYGDDVSKPLVDRQELGDVEEAKEGTALMSEVNFICGLDPKNKTPKSKQPGVEKPPHVVI